MALKGILTPSRWRFYDGTEVYVDPDGSDTPRLTAHLNETSAMGFPKIFKVTA